MVLSIIFLEDKHKILLHLTIFYEYQQFFQHRICFSIQPQLQLVNLHRNQRYFVIKLHTWFCLIFLEDKRKILFHLSIFYEYQQFFQHCICFSIQPPDYSDPWPRLAHSTSFFIIMLFNNFISLGRGRGAMMKIWDKNTGPDLKQK
jgi:hypothetical protein